MRKRYGKDNNGGRVKLSKRHRTCPMCSKKHRWPTEDKLCRKCEGEWTDWCLEMAQETPILVTPSRQGDNCFVVWDEPYPYPGSSTVNVRMKMKVADAIKVQKNIATSARKGFFYKSDQQALDDFVVCNWAKIVRRRTS